MSKNKLFRYGIFVLPLLLVLSQCLNFDSKTDPRGEKYAGSNSCIGCHKNIYSSYLHTAHFISSKPADSNSIQGNFTAGHNEFVFNPHTKVVMDKRKNGFYQISYVDGKMQQSAQFSIVFGGVKGQSYGYWLSNELFQLPISSINNGRQWINSPGYTGNEPDFERMLTSKCFNCHVSYVKTEPGKLPLFVAQPEGFDRSSIIYNIDCERCHGPAAEHVKFQMDNPDIKTAKYIIKYSSLTREQKVNMCAICHSGASNVVLKTTFDYKPGDTLSKYIRIVASNQSANYKEIDVHGNQKGLLESSKCFINSNMACATCHDTHRNERENIVLYAGRCLSCHSTASAHQCKLSGQLSADALTANCIACHMPSFNSKVIVAGQSGALVHTHHIAIYSDETQKVLAYLKTKSRR